MTENQTENINNRNDVIQSCLKNEKSENNNTLDLYEQLLTSQKALSNFQENLEKQNQNIDVINYLNNQQPIKQISNKDLINKRSFKEQRFFILRTLCLIQFHLLAPLIVCLICMMRSFISELLYDSQVKQFSYLFYISIFLAAFILFSVTLTRNNAKKIPYAQSAYVFFGIFLALILGGLYESNKEYDNQGIGFMILALINIVQGSNAGVLLYFASFKQKKPIIYSIPFICLFPLLLSLIYTFLIQDEQYQIFCWIIAFVSIILSIISVDALYRMIDGQFQLEKDQYCIAAIFLYIKMIAYCKTF